MKKRMLLFAVLSLIALDSPAQKVYKEGGKFIFEAAGLPADSFTRTLKPRTTDATNSSQGSNTAANLGSAVNNEKIAYQFEIAVSDNSTSSDWLTAVNLCAGLSGGNWRLPTQRELQMIWIMHGKLKTLTGFSSFAASSYWSATEGTSTASWYVLFNDGFTYHPNKASYGYVRCVRDF